MTTELFRNDSYLKSCNSKIIKIEDDGRVFPKSNSSQSIIDCFMKEIKKLGIEIKTGSGVKEIKAIDNKIKLQFIEEKNKIINIMIW